MSQKNLLANIDVFTQKYHRLDTYFSKALFLHSPTSEFDHFLKMKKIHLQFFSKMGFCGWWCGWVSTIINSLRWKFSKKYLVQSLGDKFCIRMFWDPATIFLLSPSTLFDHGSKKSEKRSTGSTRNIKHYRLIHASNTNPSSLSTQKIVL